MQATNRPAVSIACCACSTVTSEPGPVIVGNRFEIVGAAEEGTQLHVKARFVLRQPAQLVLYAAMPLDYLAGALENQRLRRMQPGEIGRTACLRRCSASHLTDCAPWPETRATSAENAAVSDFINRCRRCGFHASAVCARRRNRRDNAWRG
jgi:hypothetical protein